MLLVAVAFVAPMLQAASEYPPNYKWRTLTTEHFFIHFHQNEEALAARAAAAAERAHSTVSPMLHWTPRERTHLILTDHVDITNGSATPFPQNRIEVYISAPGGDPSSPLAYYDDWLELVITHEYTHILHLDQARGIPRALRTVFGRNPVAFPNEWSPLWMTEGIATFVESEATNAGRVKGTFLDMVLRSAAVEGRWPRENEASGFTPFWPGGSTRYFFGSKFLTWVARKYGTDALARYFNEYSGRLIPYLHNRTAQHVFGASISELWTQWTREQESAARAQLERMRAEGLTPATRLTTLGYETKYPLLSPDGARIAYSHRGPFERPTVRVIDVATGRDVATHAVNTTSSLSWSPDGTAIAYADLEYHRAYSILSDLYIWRIGERRERRLTRGARLKHPAFTLDGRALIAVENRAGRNRLVEVDAASGAMRTLVEPDDDTQFSDVQVSGDRIAVAEWKQGRIDVVTYRRDGTRIANLTASLPRATNAAPRFTRDGATILFTSDVSGIANIYAVPADGGALTRLTNVFGGAFYPTSLNGRTIYFADYHANGFDIARAEVSATPFAPPATTTAQAVDVNRIATDPLADSVSTPYSAWRSAAPRWWAPIFGEGLLGATTAGGDVLGFHQYTATITNDAQSLVYTYDRLYPTFTLAAIHYDRDAVIFRTNAGLRTYTEENKRLFVQASVPWRRFERQVVGYVGAVRDDISGNPPEGVTEADLNRVGAFRGILQGPRAGIIFNNARAFGFSVSRENGVTARIDYENLSRAFGSDVSLQQVRTDLRGYLTLPYRRSPLGRHVLAARLAGGQTSGAFVLQRELRVGGTGQGELLGIESRNFPVRGYDASTLRGRRAAIASLEYRLPIRELDWGPSTWPVFFHRIVGDVFVDAGKAWQRNGATRTIASTGAELSLDLVLNYFAPLRYRAGVAYLLRDPGKGEVQPYMTLETSF